MKRFTAVVSTVSCMLLAGSLVAQPPEGGRGQGPGGPGGGRGMRGAGQAMRAVQVLKDMDLKPEQKTKIEDIAKKMRDDSIKLREESGMTSGTRFNEMDAEKRKAMMEKMVELNKKAVDEINAQLTPEQKTQLETKIKEMPAFGRRGAAQPGEEKKEEPKQEKAPEQKTE